METMLIMDKNWSKLKKKAIVFDLDGTTVASEREMSKANIKAIRQFIADGWQVIFASGRNVSRIIPFCQMIDADYPFLVCALNGLVLYDYAQRKKLSETFFAPSMAQKVFAQCHVWKLSGVAHCHEEKLFLTTDYIADWYDTFLHQYFAGYTFLVYHRKPNTKIFKFRLASKNKNKINNLLAFCQQNNLESYYFANDNLAWYEVCPSQSNKFNAVNSILQKHRITWTDTVVVGDGFNDEKMLTHSEAGFVVNNRALASKNSKWHFIHEPVVNVVKKVYELLSKKASS